MTWEELQAWLERPESATIEWKENVADEEDILKTLCAFANDIEQRGGGQIACGIREEKRADRNIPVVVGLDNQQRSELTGKVLHGLREKVTPPLISRVEEIAVPGDATRKVLIFTMRSSRHVHVFRNRKNETHCWIRVADRTERVNGRLQELERLKQPRPPLLEDVPPGAERDDLDLTAVEEFLGKRSRPQPASRYLEPDASLGSGIPSLMTHVEEPDGSLHPRPRNLALLLFAREPRHYLRGAYVILSAYDGRDKTARNSLRSELTGPLPQVYRQILDWLQVHLGEVIDKSESAASGRQNRPRYPRSALEEAVANALIHRDYGDVNPVRITVFEDRVEIVSPGGLVVGVDEEEIRNGTAVPRWRNEGLVRFVMELGIAQNEGQGIPTLLKETLRVAGRPATFQFDSSFKVTIPAFSVADAPLPKVSAAPGGEAGDALILVSVGAPSILDQVTASLKALGLEGIPPVVDYASHRYVTGAGGLWEDEARRIRDALHDVVDKPGYGRFHLFYRGPVVLAPLIGALVAPVKPLLVYTYENGHYAYTHTLDKKFLRE